MDMFNEDLTPTALDYGNLASVVMQGEAEKKDMSGINTYNFNDTALTYYNPQDPQSIKNRAAIAKQATTNGTGFKPPSNGRMLFDMLGSLLVAYGSMRMFGADGKEAVGVGLNAAVIAHDKDKQETDRYGIIKEAIAKNGEIYSPQDLWNFMKTGNGKGMETAETRKYNREDTAEKESYQDKARKESFENQKELANIRFGEQEQLRHENEAHAEKMENIRHSNHLNEKGMGGNVAGGDVMHLADGTPVIQNGKPFKQGSTEFIPVKDIHTGETIIAPADSFIQSATPNENSMHNAFNQNIDKLINAKDEDLHPFANIMGGTNKMGYGSEYASRMGNDKNSRSLYETARQIQGNRLLKNVADAKANGASGINTEGEVKLYNENLPELDFSSPENLKDSLRKYRDYVNGGYQKYTGTTTSNEGKSTKAELDGQPSKLPDGTTTTYNGVTYTVVNGKWESK